jgi:hypothetical protein
MAQKARPSFQEVVMLDTSTPWNETKERIKTFFKSFLKRDPNFRQTSRTRQQPKKRKKAEILIFNKRSEHTPIHYNIINFWLYLNCLWLMWAFMFAVNFRRNNRHVFHNCIWKKHFICITILLMFFLINIILLLPFKARFKFIGFLFNFKNSV